MRTIFVLSIVGIFLMNCKKTVYPSFGYKQIIENNTSQNLIIAHYYKNSEDTDFKLNAYVKINAHSTWDTTFSTDGNQFSPFGFKSFRDSVAISNDRGEIIKSYLNSQIKPESDAYCKDENILCSTSYLETGSDSNKEYLFIIK